MRSLNPSTSAKSNLATLVLAFIAFALAAMVYLMFAFVNWPTSLKIVMFLFYALLPVGLILTQGIRHWNQGFRPRILNSAVVAAFLFLLFVAGVAAWPQYIVNFTQLSLESGDAIHPDPTFDSVLVQSIVDRGFPSTSQHGNPVVGYHVLSHYWDALVVRVVGVDLFQAFALFYGFKVFGLISASVFAVVKATDGPSFLRNAPLWLQLTFVTALIGNWISAVSNPEWVPVMILLLVAPILGREYWSAESVGVKHLFLASGLILALSLGKISIGFAFAFFVGLFAVFLVGVPPRLWIFGLGWVVFFSIYSTRFGSIPESGFLNIMRISWGQVLIYSLAIAGLYTLYRAKRLGKKALFLAFTASSYLFLILGAVFLGWIENSNAVWYFLHAGSLLLIVFALTAPGPMIWSKHTARPDRTTLSAKPSSKQAMAVLGAVLIALPSAATNPLIRGNPMEVVSAVVSANTSTFRAYNAVVSEDDGLSVWRAIQGSRPVETRSTRGILAELELAIGQVLEESGFKREEVFLYLTPSQFKEIEEELGITGNFGSGLLVKAETRVSLLFAVPSGIVPPSYGFKDYPKVAERKYLSSGIDSEMCQFTSPVIRVDSLEPLELHLDLSCVRE